MSDYSPTQDPLEAAGGSEAPTSEGPVPGHLELSMIHRMSRSALQGDHRDERPHQRRACKR
jgi:hypothetical protein